MSTTPDPTGLTALIVGNAQVIHAAVAVNYDAADYDTTDGTEDVVWPSVEPLEGESYWLSSTAWRWSRALERS